jgi:hypothetical protein
MFVLYPKSGTTWMQHSVDADQMAKSIEYYKDDTGNYARENGIGFDVFCTGE